MSKSTKIATCCYCGTRAALVLKGEDRHELSCGSCGAPLHNLKKLRLDQGKDDREIKRSKGPGPHRPAKPKKVKKPKKRQKGLWARVLDEAMDAIEDVFD